MVMAETNIYVYAKSQMEDYIELVLDFQIIFG